MRTALPVRKGFTLIEMIVTLTLLAILATAAMPVARTAIQRDKETDLRRALREVRTALDAYKKLADEKKFDAEEDSEGYPPDLETLVNGVEVKDNEQGGAGRKIVRFLRRIPKDPMTDSLEWGLRSYQDDPDADDWGGENVFDIHTRSEAKALDGSRYRDW
ncbi:MAG: type II secretion system protein [Candidatus Aminicenantales bacterium]